MRNAILMVVAIGGAAWFLLNYQPTILDLRSWRRWIPLTIPSNLFLLVLLLVPVLLLLVWVGSSKRRR